MGRRRKQEDEPPTYRAWDLIGWDGTRNSVNWKSIPGGRRLPQEGWIRTLGGRVLYEGVSPGSRSGRVKLFRMEVDAGGRLYEQRRYVGAEKLVEVVAREPVGDPMERLKQQHREEDVTLTMRVDELDAKLVEITREVLNPTVWDYAEQLPDYVSHSVIRARLKKLESKGKLVRRGSQRLQFWNTK